MHFIAYFYPITPMDGLKNIKSVGLWLSFLGTGTQRGWNCLFSPRFMLIYSLLKQAVTTPLYALPIFSNCSLPIVQWNDFTRLIIWTCLIFNIFWLTIWLIWLQGSLLSRNDNIGLNTCKWPAQAVKLYGPICHICYAKIV